MGFWRTTRVLHMIRKPFERSETKKAAAAEACKDFDDSKEETNEEFEEKKEELHPKVLEIYESSSAEIKTVVKERTDAGLKKHAAAVNKFLEELVKIDFPGAKAASEASAKFGPAIVPGPVFFVFEKVATFLPVEEANKDAAEPPAADAEEAPAEEGGDNEKEVTEVGEEKKVEEPKEEGKAPEAVPAAAPAAIEATTSASEAAAVIAAAAVAVADTDDAVAPAPANKAAGEAPKA